MTQQSNRDAWRKFLGITDARNGRADARAGVGLGRSAGRASGAGSTDRDGNPEGEASESAEKGNGALDVSKRLKTGDKGDRLEDLYDCETGEKVTIDGLGKEGTQEFPSGMQDCNAKKCNPSEIASYFRYVTGDSGTGILVGYGTTRASACGMAGGSIEGGREDDCMRINSSGYPAYASPTFFNSPPPSEIANQICENEGKKWPQVDKNHLNWNKEKGCFEALCPELNTQVDEKFQGCEEELELCDAPVGGKKVKVKINNGVTEVTQERYNQTATIKDGKVTSVKALSESQTEAAFR